MKARTVITAAGISLLLAACGEETETVEDPSPEEVSEQADEQPDTDQAGGADETGITFLSSEMDADSEGNDNDFEVSYDSEGAEIEASYENERDMMTMSGDDAYQEIQPVLSEFNFSIDSTDEEVIDAVIEGFEVEEGFQSVEIEIKFEDGTEKEYQRGN